ncbi:MAG TPA: response regulator [Ruminiclostridium sp.]|nr:response regulator [Ruminiclostridium sp.]
MYRLLIVDDEPYIIDGVKKLIDWNSYGFSRIESACNYHEAVEKALELKPDVALFDVCIDDTRGYDIIEKLNVLNLPTRYVMMSGFDEFEFVRKSFLRGVKDYLLKPIDQVKLQEIIVRIIIEDLKGSIEGNTGKDKNVDPILKTEYSALSNLTNKVLLLVKGEYNKNINLKVVADKFKMNSTYLGQIFIKETGMKFSEYLMRYRLTIAKERIETTSEKVSSIAYGVGYLNLNYFYIQFKEYFGFSPTSLRRSDENIVQ